MGMYTSNTHFTGSNIDVEPAKGYFGEAGLCRIMSENVINMHKIFEAGIMSDFRDAYALQEGASVEEIAALQEAGIRGFGASILEWLRGLWEKIKGFFENFFKAMRGFFMKDADLVKKYKATVVAKDLSKMKFKYRKPKESNINRIVGIVSQIDSNTLKLVKAGEIGISGDDLSGFIGKYGKSSVDDIKKKITELESQDSKEGILGEIVDKPSVSLDEWSKEVMDYSFEDEKEIEGANGYIDEWCEMLSNSKKALEKANKQKKLIDDCFKKLISNLDSAIKKVQNKLGDDKNDGEVRVGSDGEYFNHTASGDDEKKWTIAALQFAKASCNLTYFGMQHAAGAICDGIKFESRQARRCFLAAVAFNPKAHTDQTFVEAVMEASDYEFDSTVEGICY